MQRELCYSAVLRNVQILHIYEVSFRVIFEEKVLRNPLGRIFRILSHKPIRDAFIEIGSISF